MEVWALCLGTVLIWICVQVNVSFYWEESKYIWGEEKESARRDKQACVRKDRRRLYKSDAELIYGTGSMQIMWWEKEMPEYTLMHLPSILVRICKCITLYNRVMSPVKCVFFKIIARSCKNRDDRQISYFSMVLEVIVSDKHLCD